MEFVDQLDEVIRRLRAMALHLQTQDDTGDSPREAVLRLVDRAARALGYLPELTLDGSLNDIPPQVAVHLIAVLREGLSNVARHARALHTTVQVRVDDAHMQLSVDDDGLGVPAKAARGEGITNMTQRARQLGGSFRLSVRLPHGTHLVWVVPLAP